MATGKITRMSNKVLWEGAYYMIAVQTITLSEKISQQLHGICLVWSAYSNGHAQDYDFCYTFIPKEHIKYYNSKGVNCSLTTYNYFANKYLYISDQTITGHDDNDNTYTASDSNIHIKNDGFVLRKVIGV